MDKQVVNILLVDDQEDNLLALEAVLTSPQYNLIKAQSGEEALKWVLKEELAVIIMDVQMPGLNGFETAKMIQRREKTMNVPIIFVTALSQTIENVLHGYSVGAIDYIIKPFNSFILNSKVHGFVSLFLKQKKVEEQAKIIDERTNELEKANRALQGNEELLEALIRERTNDLMLTNKKLQKEIKEKQITMMKLAESEEQYRQLVEESPEAIVLKKMDNDSYSFINQTGILLLKANSKDEIINRSMFEFIHPDDHEKVKNAMPVHEKGHYSFECRLICLNGEIIEVELKSIPFIYHGEAYLHILLRDITELKKSKEFILQTEKLAVVGELVAGIAHEIRNPLTSLKGFTQLLSDQIDSSQDYTEIMIIEIERINTIVSELLLLTKPKKLEYSEIYLDKVLHNIITLMNAQANLYGVNIKLMNCDHLNQLTIFGVEGKVKQVFINILKNGIESMKNGGEITIAVKEIGNHLNIQFIDEGCGIPQELISKLGQPFFTTKDKGTGLGLMICYSIIESHHGSMLIDSTNGKGTTVSIRFPLYRTKSKRMQFAL